MLESVSVEPLEILNRFNPSAAAIVLAAAYVETGLSATPSTYETVFVFETQSPPRQSTQLNTAHFTVRYEGPPDEATWTRMRAILDYAFEEMSQKFGHAPSKPIEVVMYTNQKFIGEAGLPAWADGLFDHSSGTIHLPAQEALDDLAVFSRVARHELVHALLHEYLKGGNKGVPKWLVEGLAMQLAEDPWPDMEG